MYQEFGIKQELISLSKKVEEEIREQVEKVNQVCEQNSLKVLNAFQKNHISDIHFHSTTGYGYDDIGREAIEKVYTDILKAEDCLVRSQFISRNSCFNSCSICFLKTRRYLT